MPTSVAAVASLCRALESTSGRKMKIELLSSFLRNLGPGEIRPTVLFLLGRSLPESDSKTLDVGYATIGKALERRQQPLVAEDEFTIGEFFSILSKVADAAGAGSRKVKESLISGIFTRLSREEAEYVTRSLFGEMRIGVNEGILLDAVAVASGASSETVRTANMLSGDIGSVAEEALLGGKDGLERIGARLFVPLKPMLAETVSSVEEAIGILGRAAFEFKLDGARIQIHKQGDVVRIFSRRLTEVTDSLPEVVDAIRSRVAVERVILEGEAVAFTDRPLPFQEIMRRMTRVHGVDRTKEIIPIRLYLFDILLREGKVLIGLPYEERWSMLNETAPPDVIVPRLVTADPAEAAAFLDRALAEGHEGLVAKSLDGQYVVGKRGKRWLKIKRSVTLDLVITAADWGYGRREGWLSDYYLGARSGEGFEVVGKTYKGLTDEEFERMTEKLLELKTVETHHTVRVTPEVVVEVAFDEIQRSPKYDSGVALRFARIKSIRSDKSPAEADTLATVKRMYEEQFRTKGRAVSPG